MRGVSNSKQNKEDLDQSQVKKSRTEAVALRCSIKTGPVTPGGMGHGLSTFLHSKKKKAKEKRKEKLLRGCHQGQNVTVLAILEHLIIQKIFFPANHGGRQYFSVFHGPCFLTPFRQKCRNIIGKHLCQRLFLTNKTFKF